MSLLLEGLSDLPLWNWATPTQHLPIPLSYSTHLSKWTVGFESRCPWLQTPCTICHAVWWPSNRDWTVAVVTPYIFHLFIVCNTFSIRNVILMRGKQDLADGVETEISLFLSTATQLSFSESWANIILRVPGRPWEASKPTRKWYFILLFSESVDYIVYGKWPPENSRIKGQMWKPEEPRGEQVLRSSSLSSVFH